jgi:hypothetical protein
MLHDVFRSERIDWDRTTRDISETDTLGVTHGPLMGKITADRSTLRGHPRGRARETTLARLPNLGEDDLPQVTRKKVRLLHAHAPRCSQVDRSASRDRGDDADLDALADRGLNTVEEANVLIADEDVHEAAHTFVVHQLRLDSGVLSLEVVQHLGHVAPVDGNFLLAAGMST